MLQRLLQDAAAALQTALHLRSDYPAAHLNLANVLREQGLLTEAAASAHRVLHLQPTSALAHRALAVILQEQGLVGEAIDAFDCALAIKPDFAEAQSGRLFCLNYDPARSAASIAQAHRQWGERWAAAPGEAPLVSERAQGSLRIGYVSADFHRHPVGFFFSGVVEAHDRSAVEVFCYANGGGDDDITDRIRQAADRWRPIGALSDDAAEALIRSDRIDILVDLSGHTASNRLSLFSRRAAPVQASWLGYVATTGVPAMDYVITDAVTAPTGSEAIFTERLERLPHVRFCYTPPAYAPAPAPRPSLNGRPFTFGSFNDLLKIGPEVIKAWSQILLATPGSRLILKWKSLGDEGVRQRLRYAFAAEGVADERLTLRGHVAHAAMLQAYDEVDVALDPFRSAAV